MKRFVFALLAAATLFALTSCKSEVKTPEKAPETDPYEVTHLREPDYDIAPAGYISSSDGVWENAVLGLSFELSDGWRFCSAGELLDRSGISIDDGEDFVSCVADEDMFIDMMAKSSNNSVSVSIEKAEEGIELTDYYKGIIPDIVKNLKDMGYTAVSSSLSQKELCGEVFHTLCVEGTVSDTPITQTSLAKISDGYIAIITITCVNEDVTQSILEGFSALE